VPIPAPGGGAAGGAPLGFGLLEHLGDRGARKDVVELLEQQGPPVGDGFGQERFGRGAGLAGHEGPSDVGLSQQPLEAAVVALLVGSAGGDAPVQLQVELIAPHRQPLRQGLDSARYWAQAAVALGQGLRLMLPELQLLQHLGRGAAAVVAHAR
jgi:hypothetical protein